MKLSRSMDWKLFHALTVLAVLGGCCVATTGGTDVRPLKPAGMTPSQGGKPALDEPSVLALLAATDVDALDRAFAGASQEDEALRAIYRARRLALNDTNEEELRFLAGLPETEKQLQRVYQLTYPVDSGMGEDPRIGDVVYGMFEHAARYAQKHGSGHARVLRLCLLSDGELAETAWEWCDWLLQHDPETTLAAIRTLPVEDQRRMCGGASADGLTVEEALRKCRAGL